MWGNERLVFVSTLHTCVVFMMLNEDATSFKKGTFEKPNNRHYAQNYPSLGPVPHLSLAHESNKSRGDRRLITITGGRKTRGIKALTRLKQGPDLVPSAG